MSAKQRHRFASTLAKCVFASGALAACGTDPDSMQSQPPAGGEEPPPTGNAQERIDANLARIEALDVLEVGAPATARTDHQWNGETWSSTPVALTPDEQADRLQKLADTAGPAIAGIDAGDIGEFGVDAVCYQLDSDHYCLTIDTLEQNLARLDQLEIVKVDDIVRSSPAATGFCYSSWETVGRDECVRGLQLQAIVDATKDFPSSVPPDGSPE